MNRDNHAHSLLLFTAAVLSLSIAPAFAFADSVWKSAADGSWLTAGNWTGPVPMNSGDAADLNYSPQRSFLIEIPSQISLGSLDIFSPSSFTLYGAGSIHFDQPGDSPASLQVLGAARTHHIGLPVVIDDANGLNASVVSGATLLLESGISGGNLTKQGPGTMEITGSTFSWDGTLTIESGDVLVRNNFALGTDVGATVVKSGSALTLDRGLILAEPLQLAGGTLRRGGTAGGSATVSGPIELLANTQVSASATTDSLLLQGPISGVGNLTLTSTLGASAGITISGDNSYQGVTLINTGRVTAQSATALGSPLQFTLIGSSAELNIQKTTAEPLVIIGAVNLSAAVTTTGSISMSTGNLGMPANGQFSSPITLTGGTATATIRGQGASFTGGVSGAGNLQITSNLQVSTLPLAHNGGLVIAGVDDSQIVTLNGPNTYTGKTEVRKGTLVVNDVGSLGVATSPVEIGAAKLELNAVPQREVLVGDGTLLNHRSDQPLNQNVHVKMGAISGVGVYNGQVVLDASPNPANLLGGTFNGVISGTNFVYFGKAFANPPADGVVALQTANTFTNIARIDGPVTANTPNALGTWDRGTVVNYAGQLTLNAPTGERIFAVEMGRIDANAQLSRLPQLVATPAYQFDGEQRVAINTPSQYAQQYDVDEGYLELNANTTIDSLQIRKGGKLITSGSAVLTTHHDIELQRGEINARIVGASAIHKTTGDFAQLTNLPQFTGQVVVDKGVLNVTSSTSLGTAAGGVYVTAPRDAVLKTYGPLTVADDVYLNNATGIDATGGLLITADGSKSTPQQVQFTGQLNLGVLGSVIGGPDQTNQIGNAVLNLSGPITGGSLTTRGRGVTVKILGHQNTYTGATEIREGTLSLASNGYLSSTSAIVLYDDADSAKGQLWIDKASSNTPDHLADTVPIQFKGGELSLLPATGAASSETVGNASFLEGDSAVNFGSSISPYLSTTNTHHLTLAGIDRQRGATAIAEVSKSAKIEITNPPALVGGLLPWMAVVNNVTSSDRPTNFATIGPDGLVPITPSTADINAASTADNVGIAAAATLGNDKSVNSVSFVSVNTPKLDLGGHRLTVETGGVLLNRSSIVNGELTAGALDNYELILHNGAVSAKIVDNGMHPVDVTIVGGTGAYLSGVNTYTGKTFVNAGNLIVDNEAALPAATDLQVVGGNLQIGYIATQTKQLGNIRIAGDGLITTGPNGIGTVAFNQLTLEDGTFRPGRIVGNGQITKTTSGVGTIAGSAQGNTYNGQVTVADGLLTVTQLPQAKFVVNGGTLVLPASAANDITLAGGALEFINLTGNINVTQSSRLMAGLKDSGSSYAFTGTLRGSGNLVFDNHVFAGSLGSDPIALTTMPIQSHSPLYTGNVDIQTSTLSLSYADSLGSGQIGIHAGGRLILSPSQGNLTTSKLDLPNTVTLAGGELTGVSSVFQPQRLLGDVYVQGNSYLGGVDIMGAVHLADGSRLSTLGNVTTRFRGDMLVGGIAELRVGNTNPTSDFNAKARGAVELHGRIVTDAAQALLKIENGGIDDFTFDSSIQVKAGQSLQVLLNGLPTQLNLGGGAILSGGGILNNPVVVQTGGILSPGQLTFASDLTLGPGAVYQWEMANPNGLPGFANGWDFLSVAGSLNFSATPNAPFLLRVAAWPTTPIAASPDETLRWLIASANSINGFNLDATSIVLDPALTGLDPNLLKYLSLETQNNNLYLLYHVPESSTLTLLLLGLATTAASRLRRKQHSS